MGGGAEGMEVEMGDWLNRAQNPSVTKIHGISFSSLTNTKIFFFFFCSFTVGNALLSSAFTTVPIVPTQVSLCYHSQWQDFLAGRRQCDVQQKLGAPFLSSEKS